MFIDFLKGILSKYKYEWSYCDNKQDFIDKKLKSLTTRSLHMYQDSTRNHKAFSRSIGSSNNLLGFNRNS